MLKLSYQATLFALLGALQGCASREPVREPSAKSWPVAASRFQVETRADETLVTVRVQGAVDFTPHQVLATVIQAHVDQKIRVVWQQHVYHHTGHTTLRYNRAAQTLEQKTRWLQPGKQPFTVTELCSKVTDAAIVQMANNPTNGAASRFGCDCKITK